MIPVLFTTYNRLDYTKKALEALIGTCRVIVIDNGSTDGTVEWLKTQPVEVIYNEENRGVAGAMNQFLKLISDDHMWAGKIDNDTIVHKDWVHWLVMDALVHGLDIVQAKHHVISEVHPEGWNGLTKRSKKLMDGVYETQFVGGSGIIFRVDKLSTLPEDGWKLGGWNRWQLDHPEVRKGFSEHTEIKLLDEHGYSDYEDYYKETGRLRA